MLPKLSMRICLAFHKTTLRLALMVVFSAKRRGGYFLAIAFASFTFGIF